MVESTILMVDDEKEIIQLMSIDTVLGFWPNQVHAAIPEEVHNEIDRIPSALPEQGLVPEKRIFSKQ